MKRLNNYVQFMQPMGEGSLKRAAALLEAKLAAEGLFNIERKRPLPFPPARIGLITSSEAAAYHDFIKILNDRWVGVEVQLANIQVQGELAAGQLVAAINYFNSHHQPVDILVLTRGGGSPEDLAAFSTEIVTRAVAGSRIPTLVAIGHEVDISLAELAADQRASTPSNAAQLLVPDKRQLFEQLAGFEQQLFTCTKAHLARNRQGLADYPQQLQSAWQQMLNDCQQELAIGRQLLAALDPKLALKRGYAIVTKQGRLVRSVKGLKLNDRLKLTLVDGSLTTKIDQL